MPQPTSEFDLYFVVTRRRDSEGRLINGRWHGIQGWQNGVKGPLTLSNARKISATSGAEIVPVQLDDVDELVRRAFEKADVPLPEELVEDDEPADPEPVDEGIEVSENQEESDQESSDGEDFDEDDLPEYPGYQKAQSLMSEKGFDWIEAGGGRAEGNVRDAWDKFVRKVAESKQ